LTRRGLPVLLWALVVCSLLAHNVYLWVGERIHPDTDILALLPTERRDPALEQASVKMVDAGQQRLIALIGAPDWTEARRAADAYREILARQGDLFQLTDQAGVNMESDFLALFGRHREVLLTTADEAALRNRQAQFWIDMALAKLSSPFSGPKLGPWQDDPFGLFGLWAQARAQETPVRPRDGRLFVSDATRDYVVIPINLRAPAFSIDGQQLAMPILEQARQAAQSAVAQVNVLVAGVVLHAASASAQARRELSIIGIGSMTGIVLLMGLTFRSIKPIALILLSIAVGCLGALSVCSLVFEKIHLITLVFGASLIGVAQDYGIYFLCQRFITNSEVDSWRLLRRILPALILALVTTVIGYMSLALTPFPGLRQMAVFSVTGLIFGWLTVALWFPVLASERAGKASPLAEKCAVSLMRWPLIRRNRATYSAVAVLAIFAAMGWSRIGAQDDIRSLHNPPKKLVDDQVKISELLDLPTPAQFFLLRGATLEILLEREETLKTRLDPLVEQKLITGYHAISNWVPSAQAQTARRRLVEKALLSDDGALPALAKQIGEDSNWVAAIRARFLAPAEPMTVDEFLKASASEPWRHLWLGKSADGYASVVALSGVTKTSLAALSQAAGGLEGVDWVDQVEEISSVLGKYRYAMSWVLLLSYVAVYGLLYPRYGFAGWRALGPTALASVATLAIFGVTGQGLGLFHILALMLLLGIGVDYGIFFQEQGRANDGAVWLSVALSALSTLFSFGLLALSKTPALQAFGLTMAFGIITVALIVPFFRKQ
jgi:predicted exporter